VTGLLVGRRAIVAGDDAIGCGIAARLAREDADVRTLSGANGVAEAIAVLGGLDILVVNLLGPAAPALLEACDDDAFADAFAGVIAMAAAMRAARPALREATEGRIILIGHRYGVATSEGLSAYGSAAWALNGLMRSAALEWGRYGITTNLLLPFAATPELAAAHEKRAKMIDLMVSQLPLGRAGDPVEDIGGAALYLASSDARFVNGQVVHADGGQHIAGPVLNPVKFA
jgi:NAD(P)-dependent dehydrogenase (short-subunit alcohol dehydrogenase family)